MKYVIPVLLVTIIIFSSCEKKAKEDEKEITDITIVESIEEIKEETQVIKYVNSKEGLRVRDTPDITGNIIYSLEHKSEIIIIEKNDMEVEIDGIKNNWYLIENEKIAGWVFGGYLKESLDAIRIDELIGKYDLVYGKTIYNDKTDGFVNYDANIITVLFEDDLILREYCYNNINYKAVDYFNIAEEDYYSHPIFIFEDYQLYYGYTGKREFYFNENEIVMKKIEEYNSGKTIIYEAKFVKNESYINGTIEKLWEVKKNKDKRERKFYDHNSVSKANAGKIYFINEPNGIQLKELPYENAENNSEEKAKYNRKVKVFGDFKGWKQVGDPEYEISAGWIKDEYLISSLEEVKIDYEFIRNRVGKYFFERIESREDGTDKYIFNEGNYRNHFIFLEEDSGFNFKITECEIRDGTEKKYNSYKVDYPNSIYDAFVKYGVDGKKESYGVGYYFIEGGIKHRFTFNQSGFPNDEKYIYDFIYLKKD